MARFAVALGLSVISAFAGPEEGVTSPLYQFPPFAEADWQVSEPGALTVNGTTLELSTQGAAYAWLDERLDQTTVFAEIDPMDADAVFLGLRVQANPPLSGYVIDLARDGSLILVALDDGDDEVLGSRPLGPAIMEDPLMICHQITGQRLRSWVWPKDGEPTVEPSLEAFLPEPLLFDEGRPAIGVRGGTAEFRRVEVGGAAFRPSVTDILPLEAEPRFIVSWESVPDHVYRIDVTVDRDTWVQLYWVKATTNEVEIVVPASISPGRTSGTFFRVIDLTDSVGVDADLEIVLPPTPRLVLTWTSSEQRVYGFEWSKDNENWHSYGPFVVEGTPGARLSATVLALPGPLTIDEADSLNVRVVDISDKEDYGIVPITPGQ